MDLDFCIVLSLLLFVSAQSHLSGCFFQGAVLSRLELGDGLLTAARKGDLEVVRKFLTRGAQINGGDQYGWTALHCAAFKGHLAIVGELLAHGASVQSRDLEGHTPLHCAVEAGHKEVVQLLVGGGADVNVRSARGATPLNMAACLNYAGIIKFLVNRGADKPSAKVHPDAGVGRVSLDNSPLESKSVRENPSLVFAQ
jgi:ankyrin repeat protein